MAAHGVLSARGVMHESGHQGTRSRAGAQTGPSGNTCGAPPSHATHRVTHHQSLSARLAVLSPAKSAGTSVSPRGARLAQAAPFSESRRPAVHLVSSPSPTQPITGSSRKPDAHVQTPAAPIVRSASQCGRLAISCLCAAGPAAPPRHTGGLCHGGLHILMMSGGSARSASSIDWLKSTYGGGIGRHHAA